MAEATVDLSVTQEDLNGLLQDNPSVSLQLQIRALTRKCQEQANRIEELEQELIQRTPIRELNARDKKGVSHANSKKGR